MAGGSGEARTPLTNRKVHSGRSPRKLGGVQKGIAGF
jgi:hypothetical protein